MHTKVLFAVTLMTAIAAVPQGEYHHGHANAIFLHHGHQTNHAPVHYVQEPVHHQEHHEQHVDYYAHPKYEFNYEIKDGHTHDLKHQQEQRDGDNVKGEYSLHQPDGTIRIVKYYADKKTGFHADVKYVGHAQHSVPENHHHHHQY